MASSPDTPEPHRFWIVRFGWTVPLICGALVGVAFRLFFSGTPGEPYHAMMSTFTLLVPIVVGAVTVYMAERAGRRSWSYYFFAAAAANALFVIGTMMIPSRGAHLCCSRGAPIWPRGRPRRDFDGRRVPLDKVVAARHLQLRCLAVAAMEVSSRILRSRKTSGRSKEFAPSPRVPRQFGRTSQSPKTFGPMRSALHGCIV